MEEKSTINENREFQRMSVLTLLILLMLAVMGMSCEDKCEVFVSYVDQVPVYQTTEALRAQVEFTEPEVMHAPGKIYLLGSYLYINEVGKGIHVVNNQNPSNPQFVGFINIPGNYDLAGKGNFLYADSYVDLLVFDVSDPNSITEVHREEGVFNNFYDIHGRIAAEGIVVDFEERLVEEFREVDCGNGFDDAVDTDFGMPNMLRAEGAGNFGTGSGSGVGGSMARFTVGGDFLYTVDFHTMRTFDISSVSEPALSSTTDLGWGIETIFPYEDKLFLGAMDGMHIYDVANPGDPQFISTYRHITSCDPVVVQDDIAYVTLRGGTECQGFTNQLEVIDVSDVTNPQVMEVFPMLNPHGLGIDGSCLFICEGDFGLKIFNAEDPLAIDENLIEFYEDINAFDVIPFNDVLMMIGTDGLYQFSYDCTTGDIELLSALPILPL